MSNQQHAQAALRSWLDSALLSASTRALRQPTGARFTHEEGMALYVAAGGSHRVVMQSGGFSVECKTGFMAISVNGRIMVLFEKEA